ncbi:LacI family DNA-binding transcriptional regulator [Sphingomonas hankookensis]|uniref:LacI family DNA-binding transcriptional regulator n=1 Tax=Sphingomonas hankookensis TaxID=563996 RepID=UPI001F5AF7AF|nr:LacI family DNA-binding transcriptional regulator [Sphingomonas hankookensis]
MEKPSRRSGGNVTIQDVARTAGVSAMTVSRVVNGGANVRQSTRESVLAAIEQLNYSPNSAARSLAAGEAAQIGLLYANPSMAYLSNFLIGALEGARKVGCHLVLEPCEGDGPDEQAEAARRFASTPVQGVILPPPLSDAQAVQAELDAAGTPSVAVAVGGAQAGRASVRIDDFAAARAMTDHLIALGHRRIGFVRGNPNNGASGERWRGFVAAIEAAGLAVADMPVEQGLFTYRSGIDAAERLIDRNDRPTAIFASNDDMAAAAISVAHRRGLHVPEDVSIVGFDDTSLATTTWPEITTIRQPIAAMAETAVEMLLAQIRDRRAGLADDDGDDRVLDHELVVRESSGPAPR